MILNHYAVEIPLYGQVIFDLVITNDFKDAVKTLNISGSDALNGAEVIFDPAKNPKHIYLLIEPDFITYENIAHELDHVANALMDFYDMDYPVDYDEPRSRLVGWLHKVAYLQLRQWGIVVQYRDP